MEKYVSGEQYQAMKDTPHDRSKTPVHKHLIGFAVVLVLVAGLSFYGGTAYQKSKQHSTASTTSNGFGGNLGSGSSASGGRGRFGGQRPTIGQVTAVSASSITVQDSRTGSSTTLSIASSTQISDNGQTVTASDIQTGDNVLITASTTDKTQAARILVNPSFGGGAGGNSSGPGASGTSSNTPDNSSDPTVTN